MFDIRWNNGIPEYHDAPFWFQERKVVEVPRLTRSLRAAPQNRRYTRFARARRQTRERNYACYPRGAENWKR